MSPRGRRRDDLARRKRGQRRQRRGLKNRWRRQQLATASLQVALDLRRQPDGLLLRPGARGARQGSNERRARFLLRDDLGGSVDQARKRQPQQ
jgi:hypothetical protein